MSRKGVNSVILEKAREKRLSGNRKRRLGGWREGKGYKRG